MVEQQASVLRIPLYKLLYLEEIAEEPLTNGELEKLSKDYTPEEIQQIVESLRWASKHPDYPFSSLVSGIKFSDREAYRFLANLLRQILPLVPPENSIQTPNGEGKAGENGGENPHGQKTQLTQTGQ